MKLLSLNCNGIRSAFSKGLDEFIDDNNLDIISFQEVKANIEDADIEFFTSRKYIPFFQAAEKKGYSGTAIFTRHEPISSKIGMGIEEYDSEGRFIELEFKNFTLINCYFPSGSSGDERQEFKIKFLEDISQYLANLKKKKKNIILCGDINIAHTDKDIHDPIGNAKNSGYLPEEREWIDKLLSKGWVDSFRHMNPDIAGIYSWWTYRFSARKSNKGWRIDYFFVTEELRPQIKEAYIHTDLDVSDHAPVLLELKKFKK